MRDRCLVLGVKRWRFFRPTAMYEMLQRCNLAHPVATQRLTA